MAEIYCFARDAGSLEKGDIVDVLEDGQYGGREAKHPSFLVFSIPGKTKAECVYLKNSLYDGSFIDGEPPMLKKRRYNYDYLTHLGQAKIDEILSSPWSVEEINENDITEKTL